jgi:hypothetical protein
VKTRGEKNSRKAAKAQREEEKKAEENQRQVLEKARPRRVEDQIEAA